MRIMTTFDKGSERFLTMCLLAGLFLLFGCAPLQQQLVQMPERKPSQSFKLLKSDFQGSAVSRYEIIDNISKIVAYTGNQGSQITHSATGPGSRVDYIKGIDVKNDHNKITIRYYNGKKDTFYGSASHTTHSDTTTTDVVADFNVDIAEDGAYYIINIPYPASLSILPRRNGLMVFKQYDDTDSIAEDLDAKWSAVQGILINKNYTIKGSIDSKYSAEATYANFARVLKGGSGGAKSASVQKTNQFKYEFNGKDLSLFISIAPYRNGSKVEYSCSVPYTIGAVLSITQKDVETIKQGIEKIVND